MLLLPELSNQLCSSCQHGSALLQIASVPCHLRNTTESSQSLVFAWHNLVLLFLVSLHRNQRHVPGSGVVKDLTRLGKQQGRSFRGGEVEVSTAARAKPEPSDPSKAQSFVFLKAK